MDSQQDDGGLVKKRKLEDSKDQITFDKSFFKFVRMDILSEDAINKLTSLSFQDDLGSELCSFFHKLVLYYRRFSRFEKEQEKQKRTSISTGNSTISRTDCQVSSVTSTSLHAIDDGKIEKKGDESEHGDIRKAGVPTEKEKTDEESHRENGNGTEKRDEKDMVETGSQEDSKDSGGEMGDARESQCVASTADTPPTGLQTTSDLKPEIPENPFVGPYDTATAKLVTVKVEPACSDEAESSDPGRGAEISRCLSTVGVVDDRIATHRSAISSKTVDPSGPKVSDIYDRSETAPTDPKCGKEEESGKVVEVNESPSSTPASSVVPQNFESYFKDIFPTVKELVGQIDSVKRRMIGSNIGIGEIFKTIHMGTTNRTPMSFAFFRSEILRLAEDIRKCECIDLKTLSATYKKELADIRKELSSIYYTAKALDAPVVATTSVTSPIATINKVAVISPSVCSSSSSAVDEKSKPRAFVTAQYAQQCASNRPNSTHRPDNVVLIGGDALMGQRTITPGPSIAPSTSLPAPTFLGAARDLPNVTAQVVLPPSWAPRNTVNPQGHGAVSVQKMMTPDPSIPAVPSIASSMTTLRGAAPSVPNGVAQALACPQSVTPSSVDPRAFMTAQYAQQCATANGTFHHQAVAYYGYHQQMISAQSAPSSSILHPSSAPLQHPQLVQSLPGSGYFPQQGGLPQMASCSSRAAGPIRRSIKFCAFCQVGSHSSEKCRTFSNSSTRNRRRKELNLCNTCLQQQHGNLQCPFSQKCKICGFVSHHPAMCSKRRATGKRKFNTYL